MNFPGNPRLAHGTIAAMEMEAATRYRIAVHRICGCFVASVQSLPGCTSRGATAVEAIENLRAAIRAYGVLAAVLADEKVVVELEISA